MSPFPLLKATSLTKRFGSTVALDSVDMEIGKGITGLLGPNGAGKSTTIKLFLGLISPTSGTAKILGVEPYQNVGIRNQIGYMPEHECLPDSVTPTEFLTHMAQTSGIPPSHAKTRSADILHHVGMDEERYRHIKEFSTGMKQRVKLAQALVHDPSVVLLDEATSGLDPGGREEMLDLIRSTEKKLGVSIILSTHLMGDVENSCDQIIVLGEGTILAQGAISEFTKTGNTVQVIVDDKQDQLVNLLSEKGLDSTLDGSIIEVEISSEEHYDVIRDALVTANARLKRLVPSRSHLTDIFQRKT